MRKCALQGEDMKRNQEMGETATQPVHAQTADLSISGLCFMSSPCTKTFSQLCTRSFGLRMHELQRFHNLKCRKLQEVF